MDKNDKPRCAVEDMGIQEEVDIVVGIIDDCMKQGKPEAINWIMYALDVDKHLPEVTLALLATTKAFGENFPDRKRLAERFRNSLWSHTDKERILRFV